ncbi:MAG: ribokinase [Arenimonas sp.]|nr:ribokinase [Arenimonas sp.]
MSRVVVVGSFNQDHVWTADALPEPGATRLGRYATGPGGKGFNQAVAAARAGASTTFITALGDDAAGQTARRLAAEDGITLCAQVHPDLPSGAAGIFVDADGRNVIVVAPGANAALSPGYIGQQAAALTQAGVVLAQLEVNADAVLAALQAGSAAGALAVLNPAPANAETTAPLLACADILTPNETEFVAMLGRHCGVSVAADHVAQLPLLALHALCRTLAPRATLVLTLGAHGVFVSHPEDHRRGDADACYRVEATAVRAVDTTGAGDAFNGALAAQLARGDGAAFQRTVQFANRYAGLSTQNPGAAMGMPRLGDVGEGS